MRLKKSFQLALNFLFHSKLRSWLTILGIVIGIAAVVSIISISQGAQQQLKDRLGGLGADVLTVSPGIERAKGFGFGGENQGNNAATSSTAKNLTEKDIVVIKSISNVKEVMGEVSANADISYSAKTAKNQRITGVDVSTWKDITTETLASGRFLTTGDTSSVVIGNRVATTLFGKAVPLNSKIIIAGKSFNVVGITQEGSSIYIPISTARTTLADVGNNEFNSISVKITDVSLSNQTVTDITNKLMLSRGILNQNKIDFSISNPATMQATIQATMNTMTLFLGAIAAISLIVGAIGIANSMFTAVLEKTKDIGIMKSIGAKNIDILLVFLFNSGLIGLVGGIGGIVLGTFSSTAISSLGGVQASGGGRGFLGGLGSTTLVTPQLIIGALLFSILIGMISGVIPAYRASKLNPVDALRYE